jgi:hypothetical protein
MPTVTIRVAAIAVKELSRALNRPPIGIITIRSFQGHYEAFRRCGAEMGALNLIMSALDGAGEYCKILRCKGYGENLPGIVLTDINRFIEQLIVAMFPNDHEAVMAEYTLLLMGG